MICPFLSTASELRDCLKDRCELYINDPTHVQGCAHATATLEMEYLEDVLEETVSAIRTLSDLT